MKDFSLYYNAGNCELQMNVYETSISLHFSEIHSYILVEYILYYV